MVNLSLKHDEAERKYQAFLQETRNLLGEKGSPRHEFQQTNQICGGGVRLIKKPIGDS